MLAITRRTLLVSIYVISIILVGRIVLGPSFGWKIDNYQSLFQQTVFNFVFLFFLPYFLFYRQKKRFSWREIYFYSAKSFWLSILLNGLIGLMLTKITNQPGLGETIFILLTVYTVNIFLQEIFFRGFLLKEISSSFSSGFKTMIIISAFNTVFLLALGQGLFSVGLSRIVGSLVLYFFLTALVLWRKSLAVSFLLRWLLIVLAVLIA